MEHINNYIKENKDRFINELIELLKIPSISADPEYTEEVANCANAVAKSLTDAGAENVEVCKTAGHPIVYGEKIIDSNLPTVLIYGHYDVQPADPLELWTSGPFEPIIKTTEKHPDGAIFARGSCDDKGQFYSHVKAFEIMMNTGTLSCNVKFMIEGEEEVGSENLGVFVKENKERLKSDTILISDTGIIANDTPSITTGLKGLSYLEVEVTGPNRDLHSGLYGGAVANPINILCEMIAKMKGEDNHITIPGFYDNVVELSTEERGDIARAPFSLDEYKKALDLSDIHGEEGFTTMERTGIRPTLDVNGIWGGYTGEGAKTVIASKAFAKISMRLVPNQTDEEITEKFTNYFKSIAPKSVKVKVMPHHGGEPYVSPTDIPAYLAASKAMETTYGKKPVPVKSGGSIPIVALFEKELGVKSILLGFGLDSDAIHSPNEHYGIFNYLKGIETIPHFFENYSKAL
ncbi:MAG TPA: dipeptidase [Flavobacteriales bacterium]|jgi:acetylornithine deacetylase/succinyl-diaminopimelate desuccinylase-like protein|nr:dipeptidase [Flavobacteriales bacterium]HJN63693.1 dipeptidase [Flavobacteriales bacterium]